MSSQPKNLKGRVFGYLTATRLTDQKKGSCRVWECICKCGKTIYVSSNALCTGHTKSCGCYQKEITGISNSKDISGKVFGYVVALRPTSERRGSFIVWECLCKCGNTCYLASALLRNGTSNSCGCLRSETNKKKAKDITGNIFGHLKAICPTEKRDRSFIVWECLCVCGKQVFVGTGNLSSGNTTSCGCRTVSKLHEKTKQILNDLNIQIYEEEFPIPQKTFSFDSRRSTLYVDIVIWSPTGKGLIAIECQGEQHYFPLSHFGGEEKFSERIKRDLLKKNCLIALNIPLIEIRYNEPDIKKFLQKNLFPFS